MTDHSMFSLYLFIAFMLVQSGVLAQDTKDTGASSEEEIRARLAFLEEYNMHLEKRVLALERMTSQAVAFSAYASVTHEYSDDDVIIFDTIVTNVGGAYSNNRFTCPMRGLYSFSLSLFQAYDMTRAIAAAIHMDGVGELGEVTVTAFGTEALTDASSTTVYVECEQGQKVWVQVDDYDGGQVYGGVYEPDTMFSGALIQVLP